MRPLRRARDVIVDWAPDLSAKLGRPVDIILSKGLSARDFSSADSVEIRDPGGMTTRVELAFAIVRAEQDVAAVFSEHCGYMEFDLLTGTVVAEIREEIYVHESTKRVGDEV
jgi:hypothetical protein